jgi:hypothetical protein
MGTAYAKTRTLLILAILGFGDSARSRSSAAEPPDLQKPVTWLAMAARDARLSGGDAKERGVSQLAYIGDAFARAGDVREALTISDSLLSGADNESTIELTETDRLAAVAIRISAGQSSSAQPMLDALEKQLLNGFEKQTAEPNSLVIPHAQEYKNWALSNIAIEQTRMGNLEHARRLIQKIDLPLVRNSQWCKMAAMLVERNQPAEAIKILAAAREQADAMSDKDRWQAYSGICRELTRAGKPESAFEASRTLERGAQTLVVFEIAYQLDDQGKFDAAFKAVEDTQSKAFGVMALEGIVCRQTLAGKRQEAEQNAERLYAIIDSIKSDDRYWYQSLARLQCDAGDPAGSLRTLQRIDPVRHAGSPAERKEYFLHTAAAYARMGNIELLNKELAKADEITVSSEKEMSDVRAAGARIPIALAAAGQFDDAIAMAQKRGKSYDAIFRATVARGSFKQAAQVFMLDSELWDAAINKMNVGDRAEWTDQRRRHRLELIDLIAVEWTKHGDPRELYRWAQSLPSDDERAVAELNGARGLMPAYQAYHSLPEPPDYMFDAVGRLKR